MLLCHKWVGSDSSRNKLFIIIIKGVECLNVISEYRDRLVEISYVKCIQCTLSRDLHEPVPGRLVSTDAVNDIFLRVSALLANADLFTN